MAKAGNSERANHGKGSGKVIHQAASGQLDSSQKFPNLTKHDKRLEPIKDTLASIPCLAIAKGVRAFASDCLTLATDAFHCTKKKKLYDSDPKLLPQSIFHL